MMLSADLLLIPVLSPLLQSSVDPNKFNNFLILGYFAMWLVVMVYVLGLVNRQRNVKQDLELMQQLLREDEEIEHT